MFTPRVPASRAGHRLATASLLSAVLVVLAGCSDAATEDDAVTTEVTAPIVAEPEPALSYDEDRI
jgi:ABC-type glycerol-3-phosphate transport system substrate-binding protein